MGIAADAGMTLHCDAPDCREEVWERGGAAVLRETAEQQGWAYGTVQGRRVDYCPVHVRAWRAAGHPAWGVSRAVWEKRMVEAWALREVGLSFRAVGAILAITPARARTLHAQTCALRDGPHAEDYEFQMMLRGRIGTVRRLHDHCGESYDAIARRRLRLLFPEYLEQAPYGSGARAADDV